MSEQKVSHALLKIRSNGYDYTYLTKKDGDKRTVLDEGYRLRSETETDAIVVTPSDTTVEGPKTLTPVEDLIKGKVKQPLSKCDKALVWVDDELVFYGPVREYEAMFFNGELSHVSAGDMIFSPEKGETRTRYTMGKHRMEKTSLTCKVNMISLV